MAFRGLPWLPVACRPQLSWAQLKTAAWGLWEGDLVVQARLAACAVVRGLAAALPSSGPVAAHFKHTILGNRCPANSAASDGSHKDTLPDSERYQCLTCSFICSVGGHPYFHCRIGLQPFVFDNGLPAASVI